MHGGSVHRQGEASLKRVASDVLRHVVLPLSLLAASWLRYNTISLLYLLLVMVFLVLPSRKPSAYIVLGILFFVSLIGTLGQPLFQISLLWSSHLNDCSSLSRIIGFIQFQMSRSNSTGRTPLPAVDIVRHYLPDVVVFLTTTFTMATIFLLSKKDPNIRSQPPELREEESGRHQTGTEEQHEEVESTPVGCPEGGAPPTTTGSISSHPWKDVRNYLDFAIFITLGACGVAVPSLTSAVYFLFFLLKAALWAFHLDGRGQLLSVVRVPLLVFMGCHLVMVYLYQFEGVRGFIPLQPANTTSSLVGRLFGVTPFVCTNCTRPTELIACPSVPSNYFVSPVLVFVLYWMLAVRKRLCLPTPDDTSSPLERSTQTTPIQDPPIQTSPSEGSKPAQPPVGAAPISPTRGPQWKEKLGQFSSKWKNTVFNAFKTVNFVFSIVAMMLWSVLYPCWPSLFLLLWACIIWIIPRVNPRVSLYYTSPFLVFYTMGLLCLQYVYSLDGPNFPSNGSSIVIRPHVEDRSLQLGLEGIFVVIFCASLRRACPLYQRACPLCQRVHPLHHKGGSVSDGDDAMDNTLLHLLSASGVLMVLGAFILVIMVGVPSWLKAVYVGVFFISLLIYQLFNPILKPFKSYYLVVPLLYVMVLYAILHLLVIYTAQFELVHNLWLKTIENSTFSEFSDVLESIGFLRYTRNPGDTTFLLTNLVPLVIFIAALSLQLKYHTFQQSHELVHGNAPTLKLLFDFLMPSNAQDPNTAGRPDSPLGRATTTATPTATTTTTTTATTITAQRRPSTFSTTSARVYQYAMSVVEGLPLHQYGLSLVCLIWRFLALHAHKAAMLALFVVSLSQVSAAYFLLLLMAVVASPLPGLHRVTYPLITSYLGLLATAKMVYQAPLFGAVNLTSTCNTSSVPSNITGMVFKDQYSPLSDDLSWFGLHKVPNGSSFAGYIAGPIAASLILSLWMFAQDHCKGTTTLFLDVSRHDADQTLVQACKYLLNHFFDMYGLETCCSMLAIAVAVRVDVYGVFYAVVLGTLTAAQGVATAARHLSPVVPGPLHKFLLALLISYLVLHGAVLGFQYALLLGLPLGVCLSPGIDNDYPWGNMTVPLKKWLFLPEPNQQILDKKLLLVDILVYLLLCFQLSNIWSSRVEHHDEADGHFQNLFNPQKWFTYIKVLVFRYGFWLTLLLLFFFATLHISLFGCFYILACFLFVFYGWDLTKQAHWLVWWYGYLTLSWIILLIRVCLQILDCTQKSNCIYLTLMNGACSKQQYYGSGSQQQCNAQNTGLWTDAFCFVLLTLQIVLLDTTYTKAMLADTCRSTVIQTSTPSQIQTVHHTARLTLHDSALIEENSRADCQYLEASKRRVWDFLKARGYVEESSEEQEEVHRTWFEGISDLWNEGIDTLVVKIKYLVDLRAHPGSTYNSTARGAVEGTGGTVGVTDGTGEVTGGTVGVTDGTAEVTGGTVGVTDGTGEVTGGTVGVTDGTGEVTGGTVGVTDGTAEDTDGVSEFTVGTAEVTGTGEVTGGTAGVTDGTAEDTDGVSEFTVGTAGVTGTGDVTGGTAGVTDRVTGTAEITGDALNSTSTLGDIVTTTASNGVATTAFNGAPVELADRAADRVTASGDVDVHSRAERLVSVLYGATLSHLDCIAYLLVVLNVLQNSSVLSLVYAVFMYLWGLGPWPNPSWRSRSFWRGMMLFAMLVICAKYIILLTTPQSYWMDQGFNPKAGLYLPLILFGIHYDYSPLHNIVWDVLLLTAIVVHQAYLKNSGLWRDETISIKRAVQDLFDVNMRVSTSGKDYYTVMLLFDVLTFMTIVFGASSFGVGVIQQDVAKVFSSISSNSVPLGFVISLLLQFVFILADRAIHLHHSIRCKFMFQIFLLFVWHVWLFFVLPELTLKPFTDNLAAQFIYVFKSGYFVVSSLQINHRYPDHNVRWFLDINYAREKQRFATIKSTIFSVYRWIPLLPEVKEMTDWVFTNSGLNLTQWLTVEEIWSSLYPARLAQNQGEAGPLSPKPYSRVKKTLLGEGLVLMFLLLIWGPLFFFSLASNNGDLYPAKGVTLTVSIAGFPSLITASQENITALTSGQYQQLRSVYKDNLVVYSQFEETFLQENFQRALISSQSTSTWTISPPARQKLAETIAGTLSNPEASIALDVTWSITRSPTSSNALSQLSGHSSTFLSNTSNQPTLQGLLSLLNSTENGCNQNTQQSVILYGLLPRYLHAPNTGETTNYLLAESGNGSVDCTLTLTCSRGQEWWTLQQSNPFILAPYSGVELFVYSDRVVASVLGPIVSYGVIGLYLSVVVVIGQLIRSNMTDLPKSLIYDELSDSTPHMKLIRCIHLARYRKRYDLEKTFTKMLFIIMRSSERIIAFEKMSFQ